jgi:ABC-2 type transport system permease protein
VIAAILRAQFLSMRVGASRGAWISVVAGVIWYGLWSVVAISVFAAASDVAADQLTRFLPLGFLAVFLYWQFVPVLSASMGAGLDMRKMLIYPVPHSKLFGVELLLRLTSGAEMLLMLAAGTAGVLRNAGSRGWLTALFLVPAVALFVLFNLLMASGLRSLMERLLTKRKVREVLGIVLLMLYVVPRLLFYPSEPHAAFDPVLTVAAARGLPWTAAAHAGWEPAGAMRLGGFLALCGWMLAAWWFGRTQFERNLRYDPIAAQATPVAERPSRLQRWTEFFYRMPSFLWRDPLGAIVEKEVRSLARTPRFRMVFIMGFTFGLAVWFPMLASRSKAGAAPQYLLIVVAVYALTLLGQVSYWNCFGFDRSAAAIYFAAPQPVLSVLIGKNIASLLFVYLEVMVLGVIALVLHLAAGWPKVIEMLIVVGVCSLYMLGIGNLSSVQYPRGMSPERVGQSGSSNRFHGIIFLVYPLALLPVALAYVARFAFQSQLAFVLVLAIAAIIGATVYWMATESAVSAAKSRREQILRELSKGDGPLTAE